MRKKVFIISIMILAAGMFAYGKDASSGNTGSAQSVSAKTAWTTGKHINAFTVNGIASEKDVNKKIMASYKQLFFGNEDSERLYFETKEKDMAYIDSIDSNDIRSEGMSYGMIIAVMMNDQVVFNKLWKFAKTKMQHQSGDGKLYFAWHLSDSEPFISLDDNPAPDGEEYFVMALFFAKNRWGNGEGIFNYEKEANEILDEMIHKKPNATFNPMMNQKTKMVVFTTYTHSEAFTDPSYHLPAFYELWSIWAKNDGKFWSDVAAVSRDYLQKSNNPKTGLYPEYATFSGEPQMTSFNSNSHLSAFDAFRVVQNVAVDYLWFGKDARQIESVNRLLNFYNNQGYAYKAVHTLDGVPQVEYGSEAQVAMNAVGAMISDKPYAKRFIQALYDQPTPSGKWRYYNGLLHLLGLLHVSGNFKIYGNEMMKSSFPAQGK